MNFFKIPIFLLLFSQLYNSIKVSSDIYIQDATCKDITTNICNFNNDITINNEIIFGNNQNQLLLSIKNLPEISNPTYFLTLNNNILHRTPYNNTKSKNNILIINTLITENITANNSLLINGSQINIGNPISNSLIKSENICFNTNTIQLDTINNNISTLNLTFNNSVKGLNFFINNIDSFNNFLNHITNENASIIFQDSISINGNTTINGSLLFNNQINLNTPVINLYLKNNNEINQYYLVINENNAIRKTTIPPQKSIDYIVDNKLKIWIIVSDQLIIKSKDPIIFGDLDILRSQSNFNYFNNLEVTNSFKIPNLDAFNMKINNLFLDFYNPSTLKNVIFDRPAIINSINSNISDVSILNNNIFFNNIPNRNISNFLLAQKINNVNNTTTYALYTFNNNILTEEIKNLCLLDRAIKEKKLEINDYIKEYNETKNKIIIIKEQNEKYLTDILELLHHIQYYLKSNKFIDLNHQQIKNDLITILQEIA